MEVLERVPAQGDSFEKDGLEVRVEKMEGRRIEKVYIADHREENTESEEKKEA